MSRHFVPWRRALSVSAAFLLVALPSAAQAEQRIESFAMPSTAGNVELKTARLNKLTSLRTTVMLPDGYDEHPEQRWPVVYLLQGIGDNSEAWAFAGTGNIKGLAPNLPAIVVMPEGGRGFFMDWWRGGQRTGPNWTRYLLDEVVPTVESRYRITPGRQNHAIGGVSMGGYGALLLGGQLPGYFGSIVSMSGLVDSQSLVTFFLMPGQIGASSYESVWGPLKGPYATATNPMKTTGNVAHSRLYLSVGNGTPDKAFPFKYEAWTTGSFIETQALPQTRRYDAALTAARAPHAFVQRRGVHDWPYWRREVPEVLKWGLFEAPPVLSDAAATQWTYTTIAPHGNAWGLGYSFAAKRKDIRQLAVFTRDGQSLKITGRGTVTVNPGAVDYDASGAGTRPDCSFTATLPVERTLPAGC